MCARLISIVKFTCISIIKWQRACNSAYIHVHVHTLWMKGIINFSQKNSYKCSTLQYSHISVPLKTTYWQDPILHHKTRLTHTKSYILWPLHAYLTNIRYHHCIVWPARPIYYAEVYGIYLNIIIRRGDKGPAGQTTSLHCVHTWSVLIVLPSPYLRPYSSRVECTWLSSSPYWTDTGLR